MTEGIIKTTSAPCVAVGSEIMTDGERTDYEEFVRNARQKPLVIDKGEAPKGRRWMSQFWAMTYRELVVYAEHSWTDLNKREESIAIKTNADARLSGVVRWANDGYTTLEARDDLYAAALMCTSADEVGMGDVPLPSTSMVFRVSPGLVDVEYARLDAFKLGQVSINAVGGSRHRTIFLVSDTLYDCLFSPLEETTGIAKDNKLFENDPLSAAILPASDEETRTLIMVRHYVAGLLCAYQQKSNWTYEGLRLSRAKAVRGVPPTHRYFIMGKGVRADVREGVRRYVDGTTHKSPKFQFVVRGHWRNQACGPQHSLRRLQWIEPFWKTGAGDDAKILARSVLL